MKLLPADRCISRRGADPRTGALTDAFPAALREQCPDTETETVTPELLAAACETAKRLAKALC